MQERRQDVGIMNLYRKLNQEILVPQARLLETIGDCQHLPQDSLLSLANLLICRKFVLFVCGHELGR